MALTPVSDPAIAAQFESDGGADHLPHLKPVTDPKILREFKEGKPTPKGVAGRTSEAPEDWLTGAAEFGASALSGIGADFLGGSAGTTAAITNAMGITKKDPSDIVKAFQDEYTYEPKSQHGKDIQAGVGKVTGATIGKLKEKLGDWAFDDSKSPLIATAYNILPDVVMSIAGAKLPPEAAEAALRGATKMHAQAISGAGRDAAIKQATRVGYPLPPSEYGGTVGTAVEGAAGKAAMERDASFKQQEVTDRLVRTDLGLHPDKPLDLTTLKEYRREQGAVYEKAVQLPRITTDQEFLNDLISSGKRYESIAQDIPDAALPDIERERGKYLVQSLATRSALDVMAILRDDASGLLHSTAPEDKAVGAVKKDIAVAFEKQLERHAEANGMPQWADEFREARKNIAKSHMYEEALNPTTQHVSGRKVLAQRETGTFLDGEASIIADSAAAFPKIFQDPDKLGKYGPISMVQYWIMAGSAAGGIGGATGSAEAGLAAGAATLAQPIARKVMLSKPYQKAFAKPPSRTPGMLNRAAQAVGDSPEAAGLGAVVGAEAGQQP